MPGGRKKPRKHAGATVRNIRAERREISAHVAHQIDVHAEEFSVGSERHARRGQVIAPLRIAHEVIRALRRPLYCLAKLARRYSSQRVFAIGKQLGTEPAAHIRANDPHLVGRDF